ncbi:MAG: ADP-glyceromanno-heptose 6-epimerase [Helicobacteraceae bacterium]|jgi:ADP-L-glycero-D-manno-heptose 6-epimerase|nr:ADP-glyceromanno-heptose 6-epimerase [Helicobacteraceae bacterium]
MKYSDINLSAKSVLITGGAGFIGSNLALHIQDNYPEARVVVFDAFTLGHFKNLLGFKGEVVGGDIANPLDLKRLEEEYKFDYIFHEAAISDTTVADQKLVMQVNTNAFWDILKIAKKHGAKTIYASSAGAYGNSAAPNIVGEGETPENIYGFSKLSMDRAAARFAKENGTIVVGLRYFNVYGHREVYKGKTASMILQLGLQILSGRRPQLFKWGEQKRDFVYIEDVIQANIKALNAAKSGVYNVGSGVAREYNEIFGNLTKTLEKDIEVEYIDNPWNFFQNHTEADIAPAKTDLGYKPRFDIEKGIGSYAPHIVRIYESEIK